MESGHHPSGAETGERQWSCLLHHGGGLIFSGIRRLPARLESLKVKKVQNHSREEFEEKMRLAINSPVLSTSFS